MTIPITCKDQTPQDWNGLEGLYRLAFPDEDLLPLMRALSADQNQLSLCAWRDSRLVGHVAFSDCFVDGFPQKLSLLGPLAVLPDFQKQGVGSALVRCGFKRSGAAGSVRVQVLGDPAYYSRFGFMTDDKVAPPYPLPDDWIGAWQWCGLAPDAGRIKGTLSVSKPWQNQALWSL